MTESLSRPHIPTKNFLKAIRHISNYVLPPEWSKHYELVCLLEYNDDFAGNISIKVYNPKTYSEYTIDCSPGVGLNNIYYYTPKFNLLRLYAIYNDSLDVYSGISSTFLSAIYSVEIDNSSGWAAFQRRKHNIQLLKVINPPAFNTTQVKTCTKDF